MKKPAFILLAALSFAFLAASSHRAVFGLVRFGMTRLECEKALTTMMNDPVHRKTGGPFTMADVRAHFVNSGTKRPLKLPPVDAAETVGTADNGEPGMNAFSFERWEASADRARRIWGLFRDIADAKFERKGPAGEFPPFEQIQAEGERGIVTDQWEYEGLKIDLRLLYIDVTKFNPQQYKMLPNDGYFIEPRLTATEVATK